MNHTVCTDKYYLQIWLYPVDTHMSTPNDVHQHLFVLFFFPLSPYPPSILNPSSLPSADEFTARFTHQRRNFFRCLCRQYKCYFPDQRRHWLMLNTSHVSDKGQEKRVFCKLQNKQDSHETGLPFLSSTVIALVWHTKEIKQAFEWLHRLDSPIKSMQVSTWRHGLNRYLV